jgi:hypothetical protein
MLRSNAAFFSRVKQDAVHHFGNQCKSSEETVYLLGEYKAKAGA